MFVLVFIDVNYTKYHVVHVLVLNTVEEEEVLREILFFHKEYTVHDSKVQINICTTLHRVQNQDKLVVFD